MSFLSRIYRHALKHNKFYTFGTLLAILVLIRKKYVPFKWISQSPKHDPPRKRIEKLLSNSKVPLPANVQIIYTFTECQAAIELFLEETREAAKISQKSSLIGLDCEWRSNKHRSQNKDTHAKTYRVAVLQLSTQTRCLVISVHAIFNERQRFPDALVELLRDPCIIKTGVAIANDAKRLYEAFGLVTASFLDIRTVRACLLETVGLKGSRLVRDLPSKCSLDALTSHLLGIGLNKVQSITCSDWQAIPLSPNQAHYAAADAYYSLMVMRALLWPFQSAADTDASDPSSLEAEQGLLNTLVDSTLKRYADNTPLAAVLSLDSNASELKTSATSSNSSCAFLPNPLCANPAQTESYLAGKGNGAKQGREMSVEKKRRHEQWKKKFTRKKPLYDNCRLLAPDGVMLTTCDKAKIEWYLSQDPPLGVLVSSDPLTLQLNFEPAGRALNPYYMVSKENRCVVCGDRDGLVRHFVVPRCYRYKFPLEFKSHSSHDIIPVCFNCHQKAMRYERKLQCSLARELHAPMPGSTHTNIPHNTGSPDKPSLLKKGKICLSDLVSAYSDPSSPDRPGEYKPGFNPTEGDWARITASAKKFAAALLAGRAGDAKLPETRVRYLTNEVSSYLLLERWKGVGSDSFEEGEVPEEILQRLVNARVKQTVTLTSHACLVVRGLLQKDYDAGLGSFGHASTGIGKQLVNTNNSNNPNTLPLNHSDPNQKPTKKNKKKAKVMRYQNKKNRNSATKQDVPVDDNALTTKLTNEILSFEYLPHAELDRSAVTVFIMRWRASFLEALEPQFLAAHWAVDQCTSIVRKNI